MTPLQKKRSRLVSGCQRCRVRHLRCDTSKPACTPCRHAKVHCERGFNVRFRTGLRLDDKESNAFPEMAKWPLITGPIQIHDETPEIERQYDVLDSKEATLLGSPVDHRYSAATPRIADNHSSGRRQESLLLKTPFNSTANDRDEQLHYNSPLCPNLNIEYSPGSFSYTPRNIEAPYPLVHPNQLNEREATLMRNFVENMALWADITDPHQHFGVQVPVRAMNDQILRFAIFAFSSRHLARERNTNPAEALQYHNRCLQLLIPILSGANTEINDVVLAAVAILRQLEEMDWEDNQFHLTGTTHILNTVSHFGSSGGLGEAAAWLCLREDIQISLTSQKPLRTRLNSFVNSGVFSRNDDYAWASRMVFLLAKVIKFAFSYETQLRPIALREIEEEIEHWFNSKPHSFSPIRFVPRSKEANQRFPQIWTLLPVHVVGTQYYHIAKIVLAFAQFPGSDFAYDNFRNSRHVEKIVRKHLLVVLGLAKSNPKAENTLFTARHSLVAWGWVLRHKLDQHAAEDLLREMEAKTGWDVSQSIDSLKALWDHESSDE